MFPARRWLGETYEKVSVLDDVVGSGNDWLVRAFLNFGTRWASKLGVLA